MSERVQRNEAMKAIRGKLLKRSGTVSVEELESIELRKSQAMDRVLGKSFSIYVPGQFEKADKEKRLVTGIASTEAVDSYGDIVRFEAMKEAFPDYMEFGNIREMHGPSAVGVVKDYKLDEKSKTTTITSKIVDDSAWAKVTEGVYKGYSIGGQILEAEPLLVKATDENGNEYEVWTGGIDIKKIKLIEISVVDRPACPEALIESYKSRDGESTAFAPDLAFVASDLAKTESNDKSVFKDILSSKNSTNMFGKARNALVSSFAKSEEIDLEAMKDSNESITITKGQLYNMTKGVAEKAVEEVSLIKSEEEKEVVTPETPVVPETPEVTPEVPVTPESPATPEVTPETPEAEKSVDVSAIVTKAVNDALAAYTVKADQQVQDILSKVSEKAEATFQDLAKKAGVSTQQYTKAEAEVSLFKGVFAQ